MAKNLSKRERAAILCNQLIGDFANDVKLSVLLQKSALLARLVDDEVAQNWIDKELRSSYDTNNVDDLANIFLNGRHWTRGSETIYRLEHVEVLEEQIGIDYERMAAAKDPNISYTPISQMDMYRPHGNGLEREQIVQDVKQMRLILSKIKGRLMHFVIATNHAINFTDIVENLFGQIRKTVEKKLGSLAPESLKEIITAYNSVTSKHHPDWSNVASGCRRILMQVTDKISPPTGTKITLNDGRKVDDKDLWRARLKKYLSNKSSSQLEASSADYLCEIIESVGKLQAKGDKNIIEKSVAEKILIYTYLVLNDVLAESEPPVTPKK